MKKKGFTLIEMLSIIILMSITAIIASLVVTNILEKADKTAFKVSAQNVFDALDNYLFYLSSSPDIVDIQDLDLKNKEVYTGKLVKNAQDEYILDGFKNNKYCVSGTKYALTKIVSKDECEGLDVTNPVLAVTVQRATTNKIYLLVNTYDLESGISSLSYKLGDSKRYITDNISYLGDSKYLIAVSNLEKDTQYEINIKAVNGSGNTSTLSTTEFSIIAKTLNYESPVCVEINSQNRDYVTKKTIECSYYSEKEKDYINEYSIDENGTFIAVNDNKVTFEITKNTNVIARVVQKQNNDIVNEIVYKNFIFTGIDSTPPTDTTLVTNKVTKNTITVVASAVDKESDIRGYQFSIDGKTYSDLSTNSTYTFYNLKEGTYNPKVIVYNNSYDIDNNEYLSSLQTITASTKVLGTITCDVPTGWAVSKDVKCSYKSDYKDIKFYYSKNGVDFNEVSNPFTAKFSDNGNLYVKIVDSNNDEISKTIVVNGIDKNPPSITINPNIPSEFSNGTSYAVIGSINYSTSGGSYNCTPVNTSTLAVGTHTLYCKAVGGNGLVSEASKKVTVKQGYSCTTGTLINNNGNYVCVVNASNQGWNNTTCTSSLNYYYCSSGYSLSGTNCVKTITSTTTSAASYSCSSGYTLSGTSCVKTTTKAATVTCPSGYTASGTSCTKTTTKAATASCSSGSLSGSNCYSYASVKTSYSCPSGWTKYTGSGSSLQCYQAATKK